MTPNPYEPTFADASDAKLPRPWWEGVVIRSLLGGLIGLGFGYGAAYLAKTMADLPAACRGVAVVNSKLKSSRK